MADYESVLCVKNEVFVYQIPARTSNRGYRAADWKLDEPDWSGRLKVIAKDRDLVLKLEDKNTGELFAQCPVEAYPSAVVEQVLDSSRYFVIRIQDGSGRHASIGLGFADRGDSFDLLVSLQDHFKHVKRDDTVKHDATTEGQATLDSAPKLDLSFKEGQTIKLNFVTKKSGDPSAMAKGRSKGQGGAAPLMLPPPPGSGTKVIVPPTRPAPPSGASPAHNQKQAVRSTPAAVAMTTVSSAPSQSNVDFLLDLGPSGSSASSSSYSSSTTPHSTADASATDWDEFTGVVATKLTIKQPDVKKQPDPNVLSWDTFE